MLDYDNEALTELFVTGVWKDMKGYEGIYQVSSLGLVRRLPSCRILNMPCCTNGYQQVNLSKNNEQTRFLVHRLVAEAFIINKKLNEWNIINHLNGDKTFNLAYNLEWCSQSINNYHKTRVLKKCIGENHYRSKLTEKDVLAIRQDPRSCSNIAKDYGVQKGTIVKVKARTIWKHLK